MPEGTERKNIVLCFDGTGDWAASHFTNVMKIYQRLDKSAQAVFYAGGVGTLGSAIAMSRWKKLLHRILDLATATSLRDRVLEGYAFLVNEYEEGDDIYLFGFSRGAFTARLVAALVHNFGILDKRNAHLAPYLWQTISEFRSIGEFKEDAAIIRKNFGRSGEAKVKFMGLFDTVSSVGILERFQVFPYTDKNPSVHSIRHAVSIDEQRNSFPELLIIPDDNDVAEIWFPGVHRDIGGGGDDRPGYANATLNWVVEEAARAGLKIETKDDPEEPAAAHLPFFDWYVFVGLYPQLMFDYSLIQRDRRNLSLWKPWEWIRNKERDPGFRYFWPNFKHIRRIPKNGFQFRRSGEVLDVAKGTTIPLRDVKCPEPPKPSAPKNFVQETVGSTLGVAFSFLMANWALKEPFGDSWPSAFALFGGVGLFLLFLVHQGFSQWFTTSRALRWLNDGIAFLGLAASALLAYLVWLESPWPALLWSLAVGFLVALLAILGPRPLLIAQRVVPFFFFPWLVIAALSALTVLGAEHWNFLSRELDLVIRWVTQWLAVWAFLAGLLHVVQDRMKMEPQRSSSA